MPENEFNSTGKGNAAAAEYTPFPLVAATQAFCHCFSCLHNIYALPIEPTASRIYTVNPPLVE
jgi:hypothetical protein